MSKLSVFDPPMCCPTGVCGPVIDPALPRFAADLEWLRAHGVEVERYNLAQQPGVFVQFAIVKQALTEKGDGCLPLILINNKIVTEGEYPTLDRLCELLGLEQAHKMSLFSDAVAELVAIGASIASNCEPCFRHHYDKARKLGVSKEDMARAVAVAQSIKEAPARSILELADKYLKPKAGSDDKELLPTINHLPNQTGSRESSPKCCERSK